MRPFFDTGAVLGARGVDPAVGVFDDAFALGTFDNARDFEVLLCLVDDSGSPVGRRRFRLSFDFGKSGSTLS